MKLKNKKDLKQKISETFSNSKIKYKPQYIRELIDEYVSDELVIKDTLDVRDIKTKINNINSRQILGYETFENNTDNLKSLRREIVINRRLLVVLILFIVLFILLAVL